MHHPPVFTSSRPCLLFFHHFPPPVSVSILRTAMFAFFSFGSTSECAVQSHQKIKMRLYRELRGCSCGSRGFLEDRMMDIITGRAPPLARAESHLSKGSRELARPGPSLLKALRFVCSPTSPSSEPPQLPSMTNHRGFRTRPSTMSTDNPGRSAN